MGDACAPSSSALIEWRRCLGARLRLWANGEGICIDVEFEERLKRLADGETLSLDASFSETELEDVAQLLSDSILMLLPPDEE